MRLEVVLVHIIQVVFDAQVGERERERERERDVSHTGTMDNENSIVVKVIRRRSSPSSFHPPPPWSL